MFQDVLWLIMSSYVEEVDVDKVMEGAMRGLTDGLDASSAYLTPDEVQAVDAGNPLPAGRYWRDRVAPVLSAGRRRARWIARGACGIAQR